MDADVLTCIEARLRAWLPGGFAVASTMASEALEVPRFDRARVARAVPQRRAEFIGGRWCAHRALAAIGRSAAQLPTGPLGAPVWPAGTLGSITHDSGACLAIAGPAGRHAGIGIDLCGLQRMAQLSSVAQSVLTPAEWQFLDHAAEADTHLQSVFCAKEAAVKAVSERAGRFLDWREIVVEPAGESFCAHVQGMGGMVRGRHGRIEGHALALAWMDSDRL